MNPAPLPSQPSATEPAPLPPGHPCRSLLGLPETAGLCSLDDAARPGLSVQEVVDLLKRLHYGLHRIWHCLAARLTAEPIHEIKMAFSLHAHLCAQHVGALRERVAEMRHPPLGLDKVPDEALRQFFDEIVATPATPDLVEALHTRALPAFLRAIDRHAARSNPLADWPTLRVLRFARLELAEMLDWGRRALPCLAGQPRDPQAAAWLASLDQTLAAAGDLDGSIPPEARPATPAPRFSATPFHYEPLRTPRRDARFPDPFNMGVHAEEFLYDPAFPARAKTLMMYFKRIREIDVPEMMASILVESPDKPWEFHQDMTRQLWDEARHALMGEAGFVKLGIPWPELVRVNFTWSKGLNEQLTPPERHAVLWFIEQGLMSRTGKRYEWEVGRDSGDPLAERFQDYDWADEVLHARIGRTWYVSQFDDDVERAADYGSRCWSKVVSDWAAWKAQGLTRHENWWPGLYSEFCRLRGEAPDPAVLAYSTTYAETRADLQRIAASA